MMNLKISICFILLGTLMTTPAAADEKSPLVFVHGAWGGAHHWKQVADSLIQNHNCVVRRASLTGLGERSHLASPEVNLDTHIQDVVNLIKFDDLKSVILVGHSYGGAVISGVVDAIPERIAQVIYLDAYVLENGESFFTNHPGDQKHLTQRAKEDGDGWLIPVDWDNPFGDVPHPLASLVQPIKLTNPKASQIPASYWLFTDGKEAQVDNRYLYYQRAKKRGWNVKSLTWNHNPQREQPAEVVKELVEFLGNN